jgi:rRNA maturation endonuclease Nob1
MSRYICPGCFREIEEEDLEKDSNFGKPIWICPMCGESASEDEWSEAD